MTMARNVGSFPSPFLLTVSNAFVGSKNVKNNPLVGLSWLIGVNGHVPNAVETHQKEKGRVTFPKDVGNNSNQHAGKSEQC